MPTYIVRRDVTYSLSVDAESEEDAYEIAANTDKSEWDVAEGDYEIDDDETVDDEPVNGTPPE